MISRVEYIAIVTLVAISVQLAISNADALSEDLLEVTPGPSNEAKVETKFKEKCFNATGNDDAFNNVQMAKPNVTECLKSIFHNSSAVQMELVQASREGDLDNVLRKYCDQKSDFLRCFEPFMSSLKQCMENDEEKEFLRLTANFLRTLADYVCYNNGQRVKSLFEKGGFGCIDLKATKIAECYIKTNSLKTLFQSAYEDGFIFNEAKCDDIPIYEKCATDILKEECNSTSAIHFHNGLFRVIKRILPCDFEKKTRNEV